MATSETDLQKIYRLKRRYDAMKRERSPFNEVWDLLARYVLGRKSYISEVEFSPDTFYDPFVFDDTAGTALNLMTSSIVGAMYPNGAKAIRLELPPGYVGSVYDTADEKEYWEFVTKTIHDVMDNPKAGFLTSFEESVREQGVFGLGGRFVEERDDLTVPIMYRALNARDLYIDIDTNNEITVVYIRKWYTLRDIANEYGTDSFTPEERKCLEDYDSKKRYEIVTCIEPRNEFNEYSEGNTDFPYASYHMDITRSQMLRESGFKEMPVFVSRFYHMLNEKYGRSPGMAALPSIREINQLRFLLLTAGEKTLFPPVNVIEGTILGDDEVDLSARAVNVISVSGKMGNYRGRPIEQTVDVGDPQWAYARLTELTEAIKNHFFQDRLMDLNNEQRMTLGEANIRDRLRGQSLSPVYKRIEKEDLERTIERTFNILLGKGLLGIVEGSQEDADLQYQGVTPRYIPQSVLERMTSGKDVYRVKFISPAARILEVEEFVGVQQSLGLVAQVAPLAPQIVDNFDWDYAAQRINELAGGPSKFMLAADVVRKNRQAREQQQQAMMQAQMQQQSAMTAKDIAKANKDMEG